MLSYELVTSSPRKKSRFTFGSLVNDSKEDEKKTCLDDIGDGGGEKFNATTTQCNIEEEPEPNLDKVIDNIQVEFVVFAEPIVSITKVVVITTKSFQPIQQVVEPIQIENLQFSRFQLVLIFGHSTKTLRLINMFLEQVAQNATTWFEALQELSNLKIEFE